MAAGLNAVTRSALPTCLGLLFALGCASGGARRQVETGAVRSGPEHGRAAVLELRTAIDSMATAPEFRNAFWGILIVDPETGDTLYSRNAGKLFMPASNMKIVTGAVALATLGPDYRFGTVFAARGAVRDTVLEGDLVIHGRGDPSISDHMRAGDAMQPLRAIADSLAARGIHRIAGRLVPGGDAFPDATLGFGWSWDDLPSAYGAAVDELYFNEGFASIVVQGGAAAGDPASVTTLPVRSYPVVIPHVTTGALPMLAATGGAPDSSMGTELEIARDTAAGAFILTGHIAPSVTDTFTVVYPDQRTANLLALREALAERGIAIEGGSFSDTLPVDTLFTVESPPLRDVLEALAKPSQNQIAEILLKTLGLEGTGVGRADSGRRVIRDTLLAWGADSGGFVLRDGSGLSRYDYLSPETIVRTLAVIRNHPAFQAFYEALPIAGVDGTTEFRMRATPAEGNAHAKTGSMSNARSLSGYVTTADGHMLIFSLLCNNWTVPSREVLHVQDVITARLAQLTLGETN
jgi:D-alanyl-D-alanine carboxypeptidase/D-alanyl-D-alanine-endopeptidase (penicillin-binding protein 4)